MASGWAVAEIQGPLATSLCVISVALLGMMMLTGRVAVREGVRVTIGCFVLLGAPTVALALQAVAHGEYAPAPASPPAVTPAPPAHPPSDYDPYAGASLRID